MASIDQREDWRLTDALSYEHGRGDPFAAAVRATRMPMVITNPRLPDNPIVYCNQAFQALSGYDREEIVGRNCRFLQGPDTDQAVVAQVRHAVATGTDIQASLLNYRKDGAPFWNALYLSPVRDDAGGISYFFASQLDVTNRIHAERLAAARQEEVEREVAIRTADLRRALDAKTVLLHELDHRVKNNLTMIGSILRLQSRTTDDPAVIGHLEAMLGRVDALGSVHRRLYQSDDVTRFDVAAFMVNLATDLVAIAGPTRIALTTEIVPVEIAAGQATAIGLVINELLTRAVKRAGADGRAGTLRLRASVGDGAARIDIADDGPEGSEPDNRKLGRNLIERLSRQIGMQAVWTSTASGSRISLTLPLEASA